MTIEFFSADCPFCEDALATVRRLAAGRPIEVLDVREEAAAQRAGALGVRAVPAVAVDGHLADCCRSGGITEDGLRAAGLNA